MVQHTRLHPETFYHIYNRGINRENLFIEQQNYGYFLQKYAQYIEPVAETFAYCLMRNHFHLLVRIRSDDEQVALAQDLTGFGNLSGLRAPRNPSRQFANLFNAYAKAINKSYDRHGSLFCRPFSRIPVTSDTQYTNLITYIHRNPEHHGFTDNFRDWPHSSYQTILSSGNTRLPRDTILDWFGGRRAFIEAHLRDDDILEPSLTLDRDEDDAT